MPPAHSRSNSPLSRSTMDKLTKNILSLNKKLIKYEKKEDIKNIEKTKKEIQEIQTKILNMEEEIKKEKETLNLQFDEDEEEENNNNVIEETIYTEEEEEENNTTYGIEENKNELINEPLILDMEENIKGHLFNLDIKEVNKYIDNEELKNLNEELNKYKKDLEEIKKPIEDKIKIIKEKIYNLENPNYENIIKELEEEKKGIFNKDNEKTIEEKFKRIQEIEEEINNIKDIKPIEKETKKKEKKKGENKSVSKNIYLKENKGFVECPNGCGFGRKKMDGLLKHLGIDEKGANNCNKKNKVIETYEDLIKWIEEEKYNYDVERYDELYKK